MGMLSGSSFDIASGMLMKIDYDVRTDSNPVYIGIAKPGTADGDGGGAWLLQKLTYDASDRMTIRQVCRNSTWTARATATYA